MKEIEILTPDQIEAQSKAKFLESLRDRYKDEHLPERFDEEQKRRVLELTNPQRTRESFLTSIPMICRSSKCDFRETCPLYAENIAPHGEICPIEWHAIVELISGFMEQLDVDPSNTIEVMQLKDLVNQEIQKLRATKMLAQESFISENVIGMDSDGDPIVQKQLHLSIEYQNGLHKISQMILKNFLATRGEKAKVGIAALDSAQGISNLLGNWQKVRNELDSQIKTKMGIVEEDDYIAAKEAQKRENQE